MNEENLKSGFFMLYRSMLKHWLWKERRVFSKLEAWIDILMSVNYQDEPYEFFAEGKLYKICYGEWACSLTFLQKRWQWGNPSKVSRFLKLLVKEGMIVYETINGMGRITVCNFRNYNNQRNADENEMKSRRNGYEKKSINKQFKKLINNIYDINSPEFNLSSLLFNSILKRNPNHKQPDFQKWSKHIDLMLRIDKRNPEEIERIINWCQGDTFWQNIILSTDKLRKQYDKLFLKMTEGQNDGRKYTYQQSKSEFKVIR